ncbi:hypothetical protein GT354_23165 [Streptomyces sp. SID3343]|nr:hypothetical protein [Streptomyces sp. SID3343]
MGRFTQSDPAGREANGYAYAAGDPINRADPTGTWSLKIGGEACFGVCLGLSASVDHHGKVGITPSPGIGLPGVGAGAEGSTGNVSDGWGAGGKCSAGPASVSARTVAVGRTAARSAPRRAPRTAA